MSEGLSTTFHLLARTENEAAGPVLLGALDSPHPAIQRAALAAILMRSNAAGHREVLARLHRVDERWKPVIEQHHARLTPALRSALIGADPQMCANACLAAVWFREYDLVPALLNALEDQANPNGDLLAKTLSDLAGVLCKELAGPREDYRRDDPQLVRRRMLSALENSVGRFGRHHRREVVEAFAALVYRDSVALKQVLENPHHAAFVALMDLLGRSAQGSVIRLVLSFLDDPKAPTAALSVIARRSDPEFVAYLLRKIGREPSSTVAHNLKRIESIAWAKSGGEILARLDDAAQHAAVQIVMASGTPRKQAFCVIQWLLLNGKPGGRRAAAEALAEFHGAQANQLALRALDDEDPEVQARVLVQLRGRGIPGALNRLIEMLDSRHATVRKAVRTSLLEFSFERFLGAFDMLDDEVRRSTGALVKKVDPQTVPQLRAEMASKARSRRLRALAMTRCLELAADLEKSIVRLLEDDDHMVRAEAAATLADCRTATALQSLRDALADRSPIVREAARKALDEQGVAAPLAAPGPAPLVNQESPP